VSERLLVLKKQEELLSELLWSIKKFPKSERFTLGQKIENTTLEGIDEVISANFHKGQRLKHIFSARVANERLQLLIRIANSHQMIDLRHYEIYSDKVTEISKMLSGWERVSRQSLG